MRFCIIDSYSVSADLKMLLSEEKRIRCHKAHLEVWSRTREDSRIKCRAERPLFYFEKTRYLRQVAIGEEDAI